MGDVEGVGDGFGVEGAGFRAEVARQEQPRDAGRPQRLDQERRDNRRVGSAIEDDHDLVGVGRADAVLDEPDGLPAEFVRVSPEGRLRGQGVGTRSRHGGVGSAPWGRP
jgi:hypothetical protein